MEGIKISSTTQQGQQNTSENLNPETPQILNEQAEFAYSVLSDVPETYDDIVIEEAVRSLGCQKTNLQTVTEQNSTDPKKKAKEALKDSNQAEKPLSAVSTALEDPEKVDQDLKDGFINLAKAAIEYIDGKYEEAINPAAYDQMQDIYYTLISVKESSFPDEDFEDQIDYVESRLNEMSKEVPDREATENIQDDYRPEKFEQELRSSL